MVEIEIDGQKLEAPQGAMIIEVADANNIRIPRFCYHKKLSVAANCRMCLVEVEKAPKTLPACATPVTPGMKVFTKSQKALDSQRAVMEFLLINHPLDCPICDQGGECELQDNSMGYGADSSPYRETKRVIKDEDIGPLVATDLTRCIQCTRCVRFGQEIAGLREIGMTQRGEQSEIRTFVKHNLASEVSANIIDLCPVGALTSKPFRFTARAWELNQYNGVAAHDALGSNIYFHVRNGDVMRVVPKENEGINEIWLSDRDRFSYLGLKSHERLMSPMIKRNGQWHATDWETALNFAVKGIQATKQKYGANTILAQSSANATLEEYYLLLKICQTLGASDVSFYNRNTDNRDAALLPQPHFGLPIAQVENQKAILLIGSEIQRELPLLGLRLRKAVLAGGKVDAINPYAVDYNFSVASNTSTLALAPQLAAIIKVLAADQPQILDLAIIRDAQVTDTHREIAQRLKAEEKSFIYLGALAYHAKDAAVLRLLAMLLANLTNSTWGMHTDGANSFGLAHLHATQKMPIKTFAEVAQAAQHKAILLHSLEPELDCANPYQANQLLAQAEMVVAFTPFKSTHLLQHANVLLPIATLGETSGSFMNLENQLQSFAGCVAPPGEARPAWKVYRVFGNLLNSHEFSYTSSQEVLAEITALAAPAINAATAAQLVDAVKNIAPAIEEKLAKNEFYRITNWPIYRVDNLVRRSEALQASGTATTPAIYVNEKTFAALNLQGDQTITVQQLGKAQLPVMIQAGLPDNAMYIPAGFAETAMLGESFGKVNILD